jgi:hypothetical protein
LIVLIANTHEAFVNIAGATIIVSAAKGLWATPSMRRLLHARQIQESLFSERGLY